MNRYFHMSIKISHALFFIALATSLFVSTQAHARLQNMSLEPHRQAFLKKINEYRATIGLRALSKWKDGENCADYEAKQDSEPNKPHDSMNTRNAPCKEVAQSTCPRYPSIENAYSTCLPSMWKEGPPPLQPCVGSCYAKYGNYINIANKNYTKVAVGIYRTSDNKVWINLNFQ